MKEETKFRGVPLYMNGREYIVPSLSLRQYRENQEILSKPIVAKTNEEAFDVINKYISLIGMAMRRNYPEIGDDDLLDMIDMGNFQEAIAALSSATGLRAVQQGEVGPVA